MSGRPSRRDMRLVGSGKMYSEDFGLKTGAQPTVFRSTERGSNVNDLVPFEREDAGELLACGGFLTTYSTDSPAGKLATARAVLASDVALDDIIGKQIEFVNIVAHSVRLTDKKTGEMREATRTVFVGPDGTRFSTTSPYVLPSLQTVCRILGLNPPFDPPLKCIVLKQKRRQGEGGYLQLEPVL